MKKILSYCEKQYNLIHSIHSMKAYNGWFKKRTANFQIPEMSKDSFKEVSSFWNKYLPIPVPKSFYSFVKYVNPTQQWDGEMYPLYQYVPGCVFLIKMLRKLNPIEYATTLSNKGLYGTYFHEFNRPYEFLRVCNGWMWDNDSRKCTIESAISEILNYGGPIVIKQSVDSSGGYGVKMLRTYTKSELLGGIASMGKNFVIQKVVKQSLQTSVLNPSSLNTFRIMTLSLNNRVSVIGRSIRCGGKGSNVDNVSSGGIMFGVDKSGMLVDGFNYKEIHIKESPEGLNIENYKIRSYEMIDDFAIRLHETIPFCAFAAWDIALDDTDSPVLLEVNLVKPGSQGIQFVAGPMFKDRFDEVVQYVFGDL